MSDTANLFVDWGGGFHTPSWQACDYLPIVSGQTTVQQLMDEAGSGCSPSINYTAQGSGPSAYLTSIDGVVNNQEGNGFYWIYLVNGAVPTVGFGAYVLSPNDSVVWDYKHFSSRLRQPNMPDFPATA